MTSTMPRRRTLLRKAGLVITIALAILGGAVLAARIAAPRGVYGDDIVPLMATAVDRFTRGPALEDEPRYLEADGKDASDSLLQALGSLQPGRKWLPGSTCLGTLAVPRKERMARAETCPSLTTRVQLQAVPLWRTAMVSVAGTVCSVEYVLFKGWSGWLVVSGETRCISPTDFVDPVLERWQETPPAPAASDMLPLVSVLIREYPEDVEATVEFTGDRELLIRTNKADTVKCRFSMPLTKDAVHCAPVPIPAPKPESPSVAWERQCLAAKSIPRTKHLARFADDVGIWSALAKAVSNWDVEEPWLQKRVYLVKRRGCGVMPLSVYNDTRFIGIVRQPYAGVVYQEFSSNGQMGDRTVFQHVDPAGAVGPELGLELATYREDAPAAASASGYILNSGNATKSRGTQYCIHRIVRGEDGPAFAGRRCGTEDASYGARAAAVSEDGQAFAVVLPGEWVWLYAFGEKQAEASAK